MIRRKVRRFSQETTLHGFGDLYTSYTAKKRCLSALWSCVLIICTLGVGYEMYQVITRYLISPLITTIKILSVLQLDFPTVLLCPSHGMNASKLADYGVHPRFVINNAIGAMGLESVNLKNIIPSSYNPYNYATYDYFGMAVLTSKSKAQAIYRIKSIAKEGGVDLSNTVANQIYEMNSTNLQMEYDQFLDSINSSAPRTYNGSKYYNMEFEDLTELIRFDLDKVLRSCLYVGELLECSDIARPVFDSQHGLCFRVQLNRTQTVAGLAFNIIVDMNTESSFLGYPVLFDGLSVGISDQNTVIPSVVKVPTGTGATIALQGTKYQLKNFQGVENCIDEMPSRKYTKFPYSSHACRAECYFQVSHELCGCAGVLPKDFQLMPAETETCFDLDEANCTLTLASNPTDFAPMRECIQKCKPKCSKWEYNTIMSYSKFPSSSLTKYLLQKHNEDVKRWQNNLIFLNIAFESIDYTLFEQDVSATIDQLGAELGGWLGLLLGASVISIVQFISICCCCKTCSVEEGRHNEKNCVTSIYPGNVNRAKKKRGIGERINRRDRY